MVAISEWAKRQLGAHKKAYQYLLYMYRHGPVTQTEMAREFGVSRERARQQMYHLIRYELVRELGTVRNARTGRNHKEYGITQAGRDLVRERGDG